LSVLSKECITVGGFLEKVLERIVKHLFEKVFERVYILFLEKILRVAG